MYWRVEGPRISTTTPYFLDEQPLFGVTREFGFPEHIFSACDTGLNALWKPNFRCFKGGPEPLEKKIHQILGSKREDRIFRPFFKTGTKNLRFVFSYLLHYCNLCKDPRTLRKFPQKCQKIAGC